MHFGRKQRTSDRGPFIEIFPLLSENLKGLSRQQREEPRRGGALRDTAWEKGRSNWKVHGTQREKQKKKKIRELAFVPPLVLTTDISIFSLSLNYWLNFLELICNQPAILNVI